jgi:hypothetical protein
MKALLLVTMLLATCGCTSFGAPVRGHQNDQYFVKKTRTFLFFSSEKLLEFRAQPDGRWLYVETRLPLPPDDNPVIQRRKEALRKREEENKEAKEPDQPDQPGWE